MKTSGGRPSAVFFIFWAQMGHFRFFSGDLASAPTLIDVVACLKAVEILESSDELVNKLWENIRYFKEGMKSFGFDLGHSETPIIPVILKKDERLTQEFEEKLLAQKVFTHAIAFPAVPKELARLRVQISATHQRRDLDFALDVFKKIGQEVGG